MCKLKDKIMQHFEHDKYASMRSIKFEYDKYVLMRCIPGVPENKWPRLYLSQKHANIMMSALIKAQRDKDKQPRCSV